jgi:hypothetical protein
MSVIENVRWWSHMFESGQATSSAISCEHRSGVRGIAVSACSVVKYITAAISPMKWFFLLTFTSVGFSVLVAE